MGEAVRRIASALNSGDGNEDLYSSCIQKSFVLSVVSCFHVIFFQVSLFVIIT